MTLPPDLADKWHRVVWIDDRGIERNRMLRKAGDAWFDTRGPVTPPIGIAPMHVPARDPAEGPA